MCSRYVVAWRFMINRPRTLNLVPKVRAYKPIMVLLATQTLYGDSMPSISENISTVRAQIAKAAQQFNRPLNSIRLLAVSKTQSPEKLEEAYRAGQREFGENYVQEAVEKITSLKMPGLVWHFIGPIQSNKTTVIAAHFDWVHSIDRLKIAQRLNAHRASAMGRLKVCIQVNLSHEESKSGVALEDVAQLCEQITALPHLELRGLMAIPAPCDNEQEQRQTFRPLSLLFNELQSIYPQMDTLSIGMSADFPAAIAEGSTMVRVGTAIFGARP